MSSKYYHIQQHNSYKNIAAQKSEITQGQTEIILRFTDLGALFCAVCRDFGENSFLMSLLCFLIC